MSDIDYHKLWKEEVKKNDDLTKQIKILKGKNSLTYQKENLNQVQKVIVNYVKKHQPVIKLTVKNELSNKDGKKDKKHYGSYVKIDKEIRNLVKLKVLSERKEHENKHWLFINKDSILSNIDKEFKVFKKDFFSLVDAILDKYQKEGDRKKVSYTDLTYPLFRFYHHISNVFLAQIMLKWSIDLRKDSLLLGRLYTLVFSNLYEIQTHLAEKLKLKETLPDGGEEFSYKKESNLLIQIVEAAFILRPKDLLFIIESYYDRGLADKAMPVIKSLWRTSFPLVWYSYSYGDSNIFEPSVASVIAKEFFPLMKYYLFGTNNGQLPFDKGKFDPNGHFNIVEGWQRMDEWKKTKLKNMLFEILKKDPDEKRINEYLQSINKW